MQHLPPRRECFLHLIQSISGVELRVHMTLREETIMMEDLLRVEALSTHIVRKQSRMRSNVSATYL